MFQLCFGSMYICCTNPASMHESLKVNVLAYHRAAECKNHILEGRIELTSCQSEDTEVQSLSSSPGCCASCVECCCFLHPAFVCACNDTLLRRLLHQRQLLHCSVVVIICSDTDGQRQTWAVCHTCHVITCCNTARVCRS
jgi:hypothetical protein